MKKLNKKGFTLVELLAVIVVLAIIALIAGTSIVTLLRRSRANSLVDSMNIVVHNAELVATMGTKPDSTDFGNELKKMTDKEGKDFSITYTNTSKILKITGAGNLSTADLGYATISLGSYKTKMNGTKNTGNIICVTLNDEGGIDSTATSSMTCN